jgi:phosphohistidine phosphatase SixA
MTNSTEPSRLPEFFIVGHPKSGTTALYEALRSHPQIFMPEMKEPVFFATELPRQAHRYVAPATLEEYLALFAPAGAEQRLGEASASYLWSRAAAAGIAALQPEARIVAILREPASFLHSFHLQMLQSHNESEKDLRRALALEDERRAGRSLPPHSSWPQLLLYSEQVRYVEQLRRYHEHFGRERVLVLIYDDFRNDNPGTVREVLRFLDVAEDAPVVIGHANPSVRMRSQQLDELVNSVSTGSGPAARALKGAIKAVVPQRLRRDALRVMRRRLVHAEPDAPDPVLMSEIRRRYRPEVEAVSEYLDRDLVRLWGYDGLG